MKHETNASLKEDETENWDLIVTPNSSFFDLNYKELWIYRDLILLFTKRDVISQYKQTVLGPLWLIIQPIIGSAFFSVIFGMFAKFETGTIPYPIYTLSGLTIWTFFSSSVSKTSFIFVNNAGVFGKVYFPRLTVPISVILSNMISFLIQLLVLLLLLLVYMLFQDYTWRVDPYIVLFLPLTLLAFAAFGMGLGLIASSLTTKYRDLGFMISFGLQFAMYFSSVVFPISGFGGKIGFLFKLNPLLHLVELFRGIILNTTIPSPIWLLYSFFSSIFILIIGALIFNRMEKSFMDTV